MTEFGQFSGLLLHTVIVFRRQVEGESYKKDRLGQPSRDEKESHLLECRITNARGGETINDRSHDLVQVTHKLFLNEGADVNEQDVVTVLDAGIGDVEAAQEADPEGFAAEFHNIVERAEVLLAMRANDGTGEHHREFKLAAQSQSGAPR